MENNSFFAWLLGFIDAEGNFQTTQFKRTNKKGVVTSIVVKYSFHIGLHLRDKQLLELIKKELGDIGQIYEYPKKKECHYAIYKIQDLQWLITNIFNKYPLLTVNQVTRFEKLRKGILNKSTIDIASVAADSVLPLPPNKLGLSLESKMEITTTNSLLAGSALSYGLEPDKLPSVDTATAQVIPNISCCSKDYIDNWIVGFLNGEVSFTLAKKGTREIPIICLEHTDKAVMELVKTRLSIGPKIHERTRDTRKTTYRLYISSKKDLSNIIQFLNNLNNLKGYKLEQYNNWKNKYNLN